MKLTFIKTIGQGGFGIVDKVKDESGQLYARKKFQVNQPVPLSPEMEENVRKRFIREAELQGAIHHNNIVPILYSKLNVLPPYFLMPVADASLEDDIKKDRTLGGEFMNAMMDILAGLEEMHSMRYYHRDLKPANVLRFLKGGKIIYAIGDFGLMSVQQTTVSTLTQTGMAKGSDYYTAPEITKDFKKASIQSDIYSVGCILHDFVGTDTRIAGGEIRETGDFAGILLGCTRRDPSRRFKSVTTLRDALLSLGDIKIRPVTERGSDIFDIISKEPKAITDEEWKNVVEFIEDEYRSNDTIAALRKLTIEHIDVLISKLSPLVARLGFMYAKWIRESSFIFEECDGLAMRLNRFIQKCDIDVKSECLMAMLYMGTSHNRFYVERMFVNNVDHTMDSNLAKRLAVEFRVDGDEALKAIKHLKHSISFNTSNLHPLLFDSYKALKA